MVTEVAKPESHYQSAFRSLSQKGSTPPWVELVRASAIDRFELLGFPSVQDEEWKYTNLATLAKENFQPVSIEHRSHIMPAEVNQFGYSETTGSHVVLVDGFWRADLSDITRLKNVVVMDLFRAIADARFTKTVRKYLARAANYQDNGLTALNTAFLQSGVFLLIPKNVKLEAPLQITSIAGQHNYAANFPRILVVVEENSSATIVESYVSTTDKEHLTNAVAEVVLKEGARLDHYRLQRENLNAFHIASTAAELGRGSSYDTISINLGAKLSRHDISVVMDHEGAECSVDGLYVIGEDQHSDTHSVIDHKQPYCTSRQLYKGILDGGARAVFNGKIFVRHGAQKTDAMQTNKNLLLSERARVDTKPQLEIFADDVKCAHGAAVGQIDEEELFYLQTRGLNPELGRRLLTYGFAEEVIRRIRIDSLRTQLDEAVLSHLHAELEA